MKLSDSNYGRGALVRSAMVLVGIVPALLSCGPSAEDVTEAHRAASEAKLKSFERLGEKVGKLWSKDYHSKPFKQVEGVVLDFNEDSPGNALQLYASDFEDLQKEAKGEYHSITWGEDLIRDISLLLRKGEGSLSRKKTKPERLRLKFQRLERIEYVLVLKEKSLKSADLPPQFTPNKFSSGKLDVQMFLYRLKDQELIGSFPVTAGNSPKLFFRDPSEFRKKAMRDLSIRISVAVDKELAKYIKVAPRRK